MKIDTKFDRFMDLLIKIAEIHEEKEDLEQAWENVKERNPYSAIKDFFILLKKAPLKLHILMETPLRMSVMETLTEIIKLMEDRAGFFDDLDFFIKRQKERLE